ncbi:hypothetical protein GKZ28_26055 [Clostridium chromiireducens]|uniref:Uncharacterized protein n=1 Tax=Clostridium chromiireducens TaxID=225345 RepID=A0A964W5A3_9CLOT|nr:hypothetical protein [Clostridium chromiireducens]MVX67117.1 hypothetical protein [Clostridium chromiireducens]
MNKDIEQRFKKFNKRKERNSYYLRNIKENKEICIEFIESLINKVKNIDIKYLEGYELRVANESRTLIGHEELEEHDEFSFTSPKEIENIKCDIVLKNDHEELKIGNIDCDVKFGKSIILGYLKRYAVHLNDITIFNEYKDKGYGTYILKHMAMIMSYLYKGEVCCISATTEILKYDKYKIHEYTYSERTQTIERWLERNEYIRSGEVVKDGEIDFAVFRMDLDRKDSLIDIMDTLKKELSDLCFTVWDRDNKSYVKTQLEECNEIAEKILDEKYNSWSKEKKIEILENIKVEFIKHYDEEKEIRENQIQLIDNTIKLYNSTSMEQLELLEKDTLDDIIIKLYCKSFNLGYVADKLKDLGYMREATNKKGEKRKYSYEQVRYMIEDSETSYEDLKKYANSILIANRISQYA